MSLATLLLIAPVVALPLGLALLSAVPALRPRMLHLLPLGPVPGLVAALLAPTGTELSAPDMLLGLTLVMTPQGSIFLGFASLLWIAAGFFARAYMAGSERVGAFCAFWNLTLAGNLGVFLAGDVASFYLCFACVSLAAYPLVVHDGTARAVRAGLVYIVLAVVGETFLLLGFLLAVSAAPSLLVPDVAAAIVSSPWRDWTLALLVAGFGIKAGLVPLHVWLPLAHPAAPTPASAVLSGAIVKAGIFGLIQFLPVGAEPAAWGPLLVWAGMATCWFGILVGITQANPKTILAYSTVSQMGIVIAVIGASLDHGIGFFAIAAATLYALHHGLAKGALFMGVGVAQAASGLARHATLAMLALVALSIAGLPLTGGALAKLAGKGSLEGWPELLVTLSATGTTLVLLRFLYALGRKPAKASGPPPAGLALPMIAVGAAALALPWFLFAGLTGETLSYAFQPANLWTALWPMLLAAAIALAAFPLRRAGTPKLPEGDLVEPAWRLLSAIARAGNAAMARFAPSLPEPRRPLRRWTGTVLVLLEARLADWSVAGAVLLVVTLALLAANALAG